ncbi:hypothetical protein ACFYO0_13085 [Streptomyces sp. NPDC006365]|uniref:hypothetical protein n=1 Tax=Streptomyces sp. NPDC006365 TaxID=3364744 RepID=UPI0036BCEA70
MSGMTWARASSRDARFLMICADLAGVVVTSDAMHTQRDHAIYLLGRAAHLPKLRARVRFSSRSSSANEERDAVLGAPEPSGTREG